MKMDYDEDIERAVTANKVLVTAIRGDMWNELAQKEYAERTRNLP